MNFPIVDIILVGAFLLAGYLGYQKGLLKSLLGLFGNIIALVSAYFLAPSVTVLVDEQWHFSEAIGAFLVKLIPMPENFFTTIASISGMGQLYSYLNESVLPASLKEGILAAVQEQVNQVGAGVYATMADIVATTAAMSVLRGLVFIGLWLALCIVFVVAGKFLGDVVHTLPIIGFVDRMGGAVVAMGIVLLTVIVLYHATNFFGLWEYTPLGDSVIWSACGQLFGGGT